MKIFGGVEGGGTQSQASFFDSDFQTVSVLQNGPSTNIFLLGLEESAQRIGEMLSSCLHSLPSSVNIQSLGLCLSGCESEETNREFVEILLTKFPRFNNCKIYIGSDTEGSLATANADIVLIAGTGSNLLLRNPDGGSFSCGGWGHALGDEGGAYWIAQKACKIIFDTMDNFKTESLPQYTITTLQRIMYEYFDIGERKELLSYCYNNFSKSFFAGFTKCISVEADKSDPLCTWLFSEAGIALAAHILAVENKIDESLVSCLRIVCIGSVWKAWKHIQSGFMTELKNKAKRIRRIQLLKCKVNSSIGAAMLAAKLTGVEFSSSNSTLQNNARIFYEEDI